MFGRKKKVETYNILIPCTNCGFKNQVGINKGTNVVEIVMAMGNFDCANCCCEVEPKEYYTEWMK